MRGVPEQSIHVPRRHPYDEEQAEPEEAEIKRAPKSKMQADILN
jgi:hypothetical protein